MQGDVTATVSIDLPNSVSRGGLPIVSRTKQANLVGTVRFSSAALRNENTSFAFFWTQTGGPVRACRRHDDRLLETRLIRRGISSDPRVAPRQLI